MEGAMLPYTMVDAEDEAVRTPPPKTNTDTETMITSPSSTVHMNGGFLFLHIVTTGWVSIVILIELSVTLVVSTV